MHLYKLTYFDEFGNYLHEKTSPIPGDAKDALVEYISENLWEADSFGIQPTYCVATPLEGDGEPVLIGG